MNAVSVADAVRAVKTRTAIVPDVAVILGTGLGALANELRAEASIPYPDVPGFATSTVETHAGRLLLGTLGGRRVAMMQGRFHRYEGYTLQQVAFPVRVLKALGATTLIVSNVSGGMHPLCALDNKIVLREGVYVAVPGPNLETRAEYRMLRAMGADLVGMSTVPEVITAVHQGMRVLGLSIITDTCLPDALEPTSVEQIIAVARGAEPRLAAVVRGVLERLN